MTINMLTDLFYTVNFTISIVASAIGFTFCTIVLLVIITHRPCHNPANLLVCNTCLIVAIYLINTFIGSVYGFREEWAEKQPLCHLRAHFYLMCCGLICYAYFIEALSRLIFIVFHHYRRLHNYRLHGYLIVFNWLIGIIFPFGASAFDHGSKYEPESRLCLFTTKNVNSGLYMLVVGFLVPLSIASIIYIAIFTKARRSSQRVGVQGSDTNSLQLMQMKRELILARNLIILMGIFMASGVPLLIVVIWQSTRSSISPPAFVYLPMINTITIFVSIMMITLFTMQKTVRNIVCARIC